MRTANAWVCDVRFKGCKENASIAWMCAVEGVEVSACDPCLKEWRRMAVADPRLAPRCPRCASTVKPLRPTATSPETDKPLTGIIADALEHAMFAEGVLVNARRKVMLRLARENPWLDGWGSSSVPDAGKVG